MIQVHHVHSRARGLTVAVICASVVACGDPPTQLTQFATAGPRSVSETADEKLSELRAAGEGCAVAAVDSKGTLRALAVPRTHLPFNTPGIRRNPNGKGNGRVAGMTLRRPTGSPVFLTCWVPETTTLEELSSAVTRSHQNARWGQIMDRLETAAELPDSSSRRLSPAALAYAKEMLGSEKMHEPGSGRDATPSLVSGPTTTGQHYDMGCGGAYYAFTAFYSYDPWGIECWLTGGGWYIGVGFYWYYYDAYYDWYVWLVDNGYTPWNNCGDAELSDLVAQYRNPKYFDDTSFQPDCWEFDNMSHTQRFTHAQLTQGNGTAWALLQFGLMAGAIEGYGADAWVDAYNANNAAYNTTRVATSAYRTPMHNRSAAVGGAPRSRHVYGDALDLNNDSSTQEEWEAMYDAAEVAHADYIEPFGGIMYPQEQYGSYLFHVHADWRNH